MGSKIINFKDLKVEHPNRYKVTDSNGTEDIKKIDFDPGLIYQPGTPESAENFNNIQKNCIYEVSGVRILEGQEEIYDISIDGFNNFEFENLKILMTPNATNTIKGSFIRLNGAKYIIKNRTDSIGVGQIFSGESIFISLHFARKTADVIATLNGGYVGTLAELEKKVDSDLTLHKNDKNNPHAVTKSQVGLGNVGNYTAVNKAGDSMNNYLEIIDGTNNAPSLILHNSLNRNRITLGTDGNFDIKITKSDGSDPKKFYTEHFKPTKADVGLSDVQNWGATEETNDPSNTKYATAGAVKKVNDNANTKIPAIGRVIGGFHCTAGSKNILYWNNGIDDTNTHLARIWDTTSFNPDSKLSLTGGTMQGGIVVGSHGIDFSVKGNNFIKGNNFDGAGYTDNNISINSWYGIGFKQTQTGTTTAYIDTRTGSMGLKGDLRCDGVVLGGSLILTTSNSYIAEATAIDFNNYSGNIFSVTCEFCYNDTFYKDRVIGLTFIFNKNSASAYRNTIVSGSEWCHGGGLEVDAQTKRITCFASSSYSATTKMRNIIIQRLG